MNDVIIIEPFLIMPTLPCLAPAILSSGLKENKIKSKIEYIALKVFYNQKFFEDKLFLTLADNVSVQILELFFKEKKISDLDFEDEWFEENFGKFEKRKIDTIKMLENFRTKIQKEVSEYVEIILEKKPRVICFSMTFGDINFMNFIIRRIKLKLPGVKIVVGGSNFNENNANLFILDNQLVDYVVCDESIEVSIHLISALLKNMNFTSKFIASKSNKCELKKRCEILDVLPFPDFDDFMNDMKKLEIDSYKVTLPLEISRGCWWAEKNACQMCGFFGDRKKYILKNPTHLIEEMRFLEEKYNVKKFRFCDLVQPKSNYLFELQKLKNKNYNLFIEFRPDLKYEEIRMWRQIGVNMIQIGLESFSDEILKKIKKGTTLLNNLKILRNLTTLKIETYWNYLYGFEFDQLEWYIDAINIMKKIHHFYPPIERKVWINKYSLDYANKKDLKLVNVYNHDNKQLEQEYFYKYNLSDDERIDRVYLDLKNEIEEWKEDFLLGEKNQLIFDDDEFYILKKHKKRVSILKLEELDYQILILCLQAKTMDKLSQLLCNRTENKIKTSIDYLEINDCLIRIDNEYLTLSTVKNNLNRPKDIEKAMLTPSMFFNKNL